MSDNSQPTQAAAAAVGFVHSYARGYKVWRGVRKEASRIKTFGKVFLLTTFRPTLALMHGGQKVVSGLVDVGEGVVNIMGSVADALPAMTVAMNEAKDNHGALPLSLLGSLSDTPEMAVASAECDRERRMTFPDVHTVRDPKKGDIVINLFPEEMQKRYKEASKAYAAAFKEMEDTADQYGAREVRTKTVLTHDSKPEDVEKRYQELLIDYDYQQTEARKQLSIEIRASASHAQKSVKTVSDTPQFDALVKMLAEQQSLLAKMNASNKISLNDWEFKNKSNGGPNGTTEDE